LNLIYIIFIILSGQIKKKADHAAPHRSYSYIEKLIYLQVFLLENTFKKNISLLSKTKKSIAATERENEYLNKTQDKKKLNEERLNFGIYIEKKR